MHNISSLTSVAIFETLNSKNKEIKTIRKQCTNDSEMLKLSSVYNIIQYFYL